MWQFKHVLSSSFSRPIPFPVYAVMETSLVPFLCFCTIAYKKNDPAFALQYQDQAHGAVYEHPMMNEEKWPIEYSGFMETLIIKVIDKLPLKIP